MSNKKEYKRVNWQPGMDVRFDMFEQTENYFTNLICDTSAIRLNRNNFGLLPLAYAVCTTLVKAAGFSCFSLFRL